MPDDTDTLEDILRDIIGDNAYFALVEGFAGRRVYIPLRVEKCKTLTPVFGEKIVKKLAEHFGRGYINIPISREFRAFRHREAGLSNGMIATKLSISESAVNRLFRRLGVSEPEPIRKPDNDNQRFRLIKAAGDE